MTQHLVIGAIVLWAVLYSLWALMPSAMRRAFAARLAGWASRVGLGAGRAETLRARLAQPGGCGACSGCTGCGSKPAAGPRPLDAVRNEPR